MGDELKCENGLPMAEFVKRAGGKGCPPCVVALVVPWYRDFLKEQGYSSLAKEVVAGADGNVTPEQTAALLDRVKGAVKPEDQRKLAFFDCMAQQEEV